MQRWIGFGMIFLGCSGLGLWYSRQFQKQYRDLQEMCRILELFAGHVRYGRSTLPECCMVLTERVGEPYKSSFLHIYNEACSNEGECFGILCEETLRKELKTLNVDKTDKELFISCFSKCGFAENIMQLRIIEQSREELEQKAKALNKENPSKCRLALSLGTMSGLLLIVLFL